MINWFAVVLIAAGAMVGAEIGRRRAEKKGIFVSRLSYAEQRIYTLFGAIGAALFIEVSKLALNQPTEKHVWFLIGVSLLAFTAVTTHFARELKMTRRELDESPDNS